MKETVRISTTATDKGLAFLIVCVMDPNTFSPLRLSHVLFCFHCNQKRRDQAPFHLISP